MGQHCREDKLGIHAGTTCCACDHVARQDFTQMPDVKFTAWCDAGRYDVRIASFRKALRHHIAPMHEFTSNGHGSNQTAKRHVVNFISSRFVHQHDG